MKSTSMTPDWEWPPPSKLRPVNWRCLIYKTPNWIQSNKQGIFFFENVKPLVLGGVQLLEKPKIKKKTAFFCILVYQKLKFGWQQKPKMWSKFFRCRFFFENCDCFWMRHIRVFGNPIFSYQILKFCLIKLK